MAEASIQDSGEQELGGISHLRDAVYRVPSLSEPGVFYDVDLEDPFCSHPYYKDEFCKHLILAEAVAAVRLEKDSDSDLEDWLIETVARIFAPIRKKNVTPADSWEITNHVLSCRFSTPRLKTAAWTWHGRVIEAYARGRAA